MTCHTGPSGRSTFGRVAPRFCAAAGTVRNATAAAATTSRATQTVVLQNLDFIRNISALTSSQSGQAPRAVAETVSMNVEQIQKTEEHVGTSLYVIGEDDVTIPLELSIDAADQLHRHFLMR